MQKEKIIGSLIGVLFAILFIFVGAFEAIFIGLAGLIGYYLVDDSNIKREKVLNLFGKVLSLSGEYIGILIGVIFAILVLNIGFWKTLFVGICAAAGYFIGKKFSNKDELIEFLDKILPPGKI